MISLLQKNFIDPLISALAIEWGVEYFLIEEGVRGKVTRYIQATFAGLPLPLRVIIYSLCLLFLFSTLCFFGRGFRSLPSTKAIRQIQRWRRSNFPGCAQLMQLFENLIALSMFANGMSNERKRPS